MSVTTRVLTGESLAAALDDVARLRIAVFRDWPYLYDGNADYERDYLRAYRSPGAVVVAAMDGARIVGAATGAPMGAAAARAVLRFSSSSSSLLSSTGASLLMPLPRSGRATGGGATGDGARAKRPSSSR